MKVLFVQDDYSTAADLHDDLQTLGYSSFAAENTAEALTKISEIQPDAVIVDLDLRSDPDILDFAEQVRKRYNLPLILLVSRTTNERLKHAKLTEPAGYLLAPFGLNVLHTILESAVYKHRSELKRKEQWLETVLNIVSGPSAHAFEKERALTVRAEDAVIAIDSAGRLSFMNPVAERLTGWKQEEALGRALTDVLNLLVELENDTILISRDGTERIVAGSIAPLKDEQSNIKGMVLAFQDIGQRREAERAEALDRGQRVFRSLIENASDIILILNLDGSIRYASPSIERILGHNRKEVQGQRIISLLHPEDSGLLFQALAEAGGRREDLRAIELRFQHKDGSYRTLEVLFNNLLRNPRVAGLVVNGRDITERKRTEEALRVSEERFALAVRGATDGLWDWDIKANTIYFSPRWKFMIGYEDHEIGDDPEEWFSRVHSDFLDRLKMEISQHLNGSSSHLEVEYLFQHKNGRYIWMLCRGLAVYDSAGSATRMAGSQTDITTRKMAEEQLLRDAFFDVLTGLPNRALFMDRLGQAIRRAKRHSEYSFAVLFLDLDRFKNVNDSLGHIVGDQLLSEVAGRLQSCLRPEDTVARLGGDEFCLLADGIRDVSDAARISDRVQRELTQPFLIAGQEIFTSASIGIALSSSAYDKPEELLRDADTAMYRAKSLGKARHEVFDKEMHARAVGLLQLESDMRRAIERQEFALHYQPLVSLDNGSLYGFEALIRWHHPQRGFILARDFIPLAEETGLIIPMGNMVLREACLQMRRWHSLNPALSVSVNVSSKQLAQPDIFEYTEKLLEESRIDPTKLVLEITESLIMENPKVSINTLGNLRVLRTKLSLDDFGKGHSSLSRLQNIPIDIMKIDRSFLADIGQNRNNAAIVQAIVTLAKNLGLDVIAEGIETEEQRAFLKTLGCQYGQGFLFSKAVDAGEAEKMIVEDRRWQES